MYSLIDPMQQDGNLFLIQECYILGWNFRVWKIMANEDKKYTAIFRAKF